MADKKPPPDYYFEMRLLPYQRDVLVKLLEGEKISQGQVKGLLTRARGARRYNLPAVEVPWEEYEGKAKKRGESLADFIYDQEGK